MDTDFTVESGLANKPGQLNDEAGRAQSKFSGDEAEAGFSRAVGPEGSSVAAGGAVGIGERHMGHLDEFDARDEGERAAHLGDIDAQGSVGGAAESIAGAHDPNSDLGRADQLAFNERDKAAARVDAVDNARDDARNAVADPRASITAHADAAVTAEATRRAPIDVSAAEANANLATEAAGNPELAAKNRAEAALDAKEYEAKGEIGIEGTGTSRNRPEPGSGNKT